MFGSLGRIGLNLGTAFTPASLFSSGEQGVWYDPSDFSTMFQDSAGTIPVTAVDQPVGLIRDKSGRGNHASQATAGKLPLLKTDGSGRYFLLFDGLNDNLSTASINFTATDKVSVFAGVRKLSDSAVAMVSELSANATAGTNNGAFFLAAPRGGGTADFGFRSLGTIAADATTAASYASPITAVLSGLGNISGDSSILRLNGAQVASSAADEGTGNYGNYPLYVGSRGGTTFFFNGRLYSLIVRGALSSSSEIASTEAWVNSKTGAY